MERQRAGSPAHLDGWGGRAGARRLLRVASDRRGAPDSIVGLSATGDRDVVRSDATLIRALQGGSEEAAAELVRRHWPRSWRAAYAITGRRESAEDVVQDAFERALRGLDRFDQQRPFAPWLHRIVVNRAIDVLKSDRRDATALEEGMVGQEDTRQRERELMEALGQLSPERRGVVVMRYLLGYAPPEIATLLELEVGTVHSRLARGLKELRTILEDI